MSEAYAIIQPAIWFAAGEFQVGSGQMRPLIISCARLADGNGGRAKQGLSVLVEGGRVVAVGPEAQVAASAPPECEIVAFPQHCLIPGLIDTHTHTSLSGDGRNYAQQFSDPDELMVLIGAANLQKHLSSGITTLREHGARNRVGFMIREGVRRGYIAGPRMLVSGRPVTCTNGHFHFCNEVADGEEAIRRSVRRLVHEGADYIKIMASGGGTEGTDPGLPSYSVDELRAAAHEAHNFHRLTAAHCRATESIRRAVEAGIDLIEHVEFLDPDGEMRLNPSIAQLLGEAGVYLSPTLQAWTRYPRIVELREAREKPEFAKADAEELRTLENRMAKRLEIFRRLLEYGLAERMTPGTDSGPNNIAFGHMDYDLQLFVEAGFAPADALVAVTRTSAEAVGLGREIGTIEAGKAADLVTVEGDPTADVTALSRVSAVFLAGQRVR